MGKAGIIVLGAVIIGTALGVFFSTTFSLLPTGGLPLLCGLVGLVVSASLVTGFDALRRRAATPVPVPPPVVEPPPKPAKP